MKPAKHSEAAMDDPERIGLQNRADVYPGDGRQWCEDKVWPENDDEEEPVEYIRADIAAAHTRAAVEAERAACEAVAREPRMFHAAEVADAIAARKGGPK